MATVTVFVCNGGGGTTIPNVTLTDTRPVPHCASGGAWQTVTYAEAAGGFDPADLDPSELAAAFGAGFIVMGTGLVLAWALRAVLRAIWNW